MAGRNREAVLNHQEDDSDAGRWYDLMTMTLDSFEIDTIRKWPHAAARIILLATRIFFFV